jgi:protein TonB
MFQELLVSSRKRERFGFRTILVSALIHGSIVGILLLIPLIYYDQIPSNSLISFIIEAKAPDPPAPPSPPPPEPAHRPDPVDKPTRIFQPEGLVIPPVIPDQIPEPGALLPEINSIDYGPAMSGFIGGSVGAGQSEELSGFFSAGPPEPPPPPPPAEIKEPVRQGGNVQASRLIRRINPAYPELAKRARVSGMVILEVVVDELGNVEEIEIIRGHPLLNQAAVEAVRQWKYSPTLLNGEPVSVIATVTVNFVLR